MRISLLGAPAAHSLARDVHKAAADLTRTIERRLRKPAQAARDEIRGKILHADMRGSRKFGAKTRFTAHIPSRGVRRPTSRAVQSEVKVANGNPHVRIELRAEQVPGRIRALLPYWAGDRKPLRHPVMGDRQTWVGQRIPDVWDLPNEAQFAQAVDDALDDTVRAIEGG